MDRTPPPEIQQLLRREVGYGCPIQGCGQPWLTWHHFDPEWRVEQHHRPEGLIALCWTHHLQARNFTVDQLRELKRNHQQATSIERPQVRFPWMRQELLLFLGGSIYHETPVAFRFNDQDVISVRRNHEGYMTLSARMLTISGQPRMEITNNFFTVPPRLDETEMAFLPSGHLVSVKYSNGDKLWVRFDDIETAARLMKVTGIDASRLQLTYPISLVQVENEIGGTGLSFGPMASKMGGVAIVGSVVSRCGAGIVYRGSLDAPR